MKGKPLLPTLRTKKRYAVYEVISKGPKFSHSTIMSAISSSYKEYFGVFGLGESGMMDARVFDYGMQRGILKINHKYLDKLRTAMAMIEKIEGYDAIVRTIGVSGIIKKTKDKYMGRTSRQTKEGEYATTATSDDGL